MKSSVTAVVVVAAALAPAVGFAQSASTETQLQQELRHRRVIVRPVTPPDEVARDADAAVVELTERERERDQVVRDLRRPAPRAPQMDQDLKGGIQTRSLNNALRR
jgi:hypothetical protein